jgi:hypothetical protein
LEQRPCRRYNAAQQILVGPKDTFAKPNNNLFSQDVSKLLCRYDKRPKLCLKKKQAVEKVL